MSTPTPICRNCTYFSIGGRDPRLVDELDEVRALCRHPSAEIGASPVTGLATCASLRATGPCGATGAWFKQRVGLSAKV
jgi:hypothetical protein